MPDKPASNPAKPAPTGGNKKSNKTLFIVIGVVVAIFVVLPAILFASGLAFVSHKVAENGININGSSGTVSVKSKNGDEFTAGTTKSLPKDFPSSVSVYKGTIVASGRLTTDGKVGWSVSMTTKDNPDTVANSLTQAFSTNGWVSDANNTSTDGGLILAHNDQYQTNVIYSTKDGTTTIVYTVAQKTT